MDPRAGERARHVLVIEDSATIRLEIEGILSAAGFTVTTAVDGRAGLARLERRLPDLVLCDLMMPELNGFDVLAALRRHPQWATVPFICLTARCERTAMRRAMEMGADDYVTKPVTGAELVSAVTAGLDKRARVEHETATRLGDLQRSITLALPHEFRTPLSIVLGYSELLIDAAEERADSDLRSIARSVLTAATQLHRLTENFLLFAQLELLGRDEGALHVLEVDRATALDDVARRVAKTVSATYARGEDLVLELEPVAVFVRKDVLSKLVTELVDNAFKFSPSGTRVRVATHAASEGGQLVVSDRGAGMAASQVAALAPYLQFDRTTHEQQGLGLGLGIVRRVVEICGGVLHFESEAGGGTTVTLRLPAGRPPAP